MIPGYMVDEPLFSQDMMEGEYTTWTLVFDHDYTPARLCHHPLVDNYGWVYSSDAPLGIGLNIMDYYENDTWQAAERIHHVVEELPFSVNRKYVITEDTATLTTFRVWRRGVNIFTRDVTADRGNISQIQHIFMSPNGKFIALACDDAVSGGFAILMLYEGT